MMKITEGFIQNLDSRMYVTHTASMSKMNTRNQEFAAKLDLTSDLKGMICSATVNAKKGFWLSSEDQANNQYSFPEKLDPKNKQVLIPALDWNKQEVIAPYFALTTTSSLAVAHEMFVRLKKWDVNFRQWALISQVDTRCNELAREQNGLIRMFAKSCVSDISVAKKWTGSFLMLEATCLEMNISAGQLAVGFPSVAAIGGVIHSLEKKIGKEIPFALGFKKIDWVSAGKKRESAEEIVGNAEIVILLKKDNLKAEEILQIKAGMACIDRLAGSKLIHKKISVVENGVAPTARYLFDAKEDLLESMKANAGFDVLDSAISLYSDNRKGFTINCVGYGFLEKPSQKENSRFGCPHMLSELLFGAVGQSAMGDNCWWLRRVTDEAGFWCGLDSVLA